MYSHSKENIYPIQGDYRYAFPLSVLYIYRKIIRIIAHKKLPVALVVECVYGTHVFRILNENGKIFHNFLLGVNPDNNTWTEKDFNTTILPIKFENKLQVVNCNSKLDTKLSIKEGV